MFQKQINLSWVAIAGVIGLTIGGLGAKFYYSGSAAAGASPYSSADLTSTNNKESYSLGVVIGQQVQATIKTTNMQIESAAFLEGVNDSIQEKEPRLKPDDIYQNVNNLQDSANKSLTSALETKAIDKQSVLFANSTTPQVGNGELTMVEFFDYNCPHCRSLNSDIINLVSQNSNIKILYRPIGLMTKGSQAAAIAALAANKQNKFKEVHNAFITEQGEITEDLVKQIVAKLPLDQEQFARDVISSAIVEQATNNRKIFMDLGLKGVPSLFAAKLDNDNNVKDKNLVFVSGNNITAINESLNKLK